MISIYTGRGPWKYLLEKANGSILKINILYLYDHKNNVYQDRSSDGLWVVMHPVIGKNMSRLAASIVHKCFQLVPDLIQIDRQITP